MKIIKRWTSTISSSFDWMISQVENHEALVNCALREMNEASAKARVQLARVKQDGTKMRERLEELRCAAENWEARAIKASKEDKEKALECIKRKKQTEREITSLETGVCEHRTLERQLQADLKEIEARLEQLKRKKHAFRAKANIAHASKVTNPDNLGIVEEIDDIFDRWEVKLAQCETYTNTTDTFEDEFEQEEEKQALESELEELVANQAN